MREDRSIGSFVRAVTGGIVGFSIQAKCPARLTFCIMIPSALHFIPGGGKSILWLPLFAPCFPHSTAEHWLASACGVGLLTQCITLSTWTMMYTNPNCNIPRCKTRSIEAVHRTHGSLNIPVCVETPFLNQADGVASTQPTRLLDSGCVRKEQAGSSW